MLLKDQRDRPFKKHIADVRDIVHGCLCALGKERALGETFQLAGPRPFTWDEVSYRLAALRDMPHVEAAVQATPTFYEFDLRKAEEYLGFSPSYDIVRMMVDALTISAAKTSEYCRTAEAQVSCGTNSVAIAARTSSVRKGL